MSLTPEQIADRVKKEVWKQVPGYRGCYEVSNLGRVRSLDMSIPHWRGGRLIRKGTILSPWISNNGYPMATLRGKSRHASVHRLVLKTFKPTRAKLQTNHIDGNKKNNRLDNLEWVTASQNIRHAFALGLNPGNGWKRRVRCLESGELFDSISGAARQLGLHRECVRDVCAGRVKTTGGMRFEYAD